ncbi:hypothetical protein CEUSTIGMA_g3844.t1 [Chlamydomonas eustigma]|uniref:Tryptophan synthase beta chain-like PALP domain-containing protein n=1 Tax=Chlamydomonas eustigma TaxID=1157962 RepID=A0A250X0C7_9CHLO|nr:hypothetical protein CEUSTIGMA_g3844.t1 [Chlamydomonas eustigma]|eukprot:GAX76399.1 hypothetical protein CEUSTIGMA_g3844.t1 [Chlamydomonas eustigma]
MRLLSGWSLGTGQSNAISSAVLEASVRIQGHVHLTPVEPSPWLSGLSGLTVHLKLESEQRTGSFKVRGAVNKVLSLSSSELDRGMVTSSTGNHALAFMYACSCLEKLREEAAERSTKCNSAAGAVRPAIYLPSSASAYKVNKVRAQGTADIILFGNDCVESENEAARVAQLKGATYISPYNDLQVMAGQGTISIDLMQQLPRKSVDIVFIPVGGGGLISGMAAMLKAADPSIWVVGCQPAASDVMRQSVQAGCVIDVPSHPTLSDATAGGIEEGALTLQPCTDYVDEWVLVSEDEIRAAVVGVLKHHSKLIEGAAGCAVAALIKSSSNAELQGKSAVVLCCGGNISFSTLSELICKEINYN